MTEQDKHKLREIRMGDVVVWDTGRGRVAGWSSVHAPYMLLVYGGYSGPDLRVPLYRVLARERPGQPGVVRFNETSSQGGNNR